MASLLLNVLTTSVALRVLSFLVNTLTLRISSNSLGDFGEVQVKLGIFLSICMYPLKEGTRRACLQSKSLRGLLSIFGLKVSWFITIIATFLIFCAHVKDHEWLIGYFVCALCCLLESAAEPVLIDKLLKNEALKINAESTASVVRSLAMLVSLSAFLDEFEPHEAHIFAFSVAQFAYSITFMFTIFLSKTGEEDGELVDTVFEKKVSNLFLLKECSTWLLISVQKLCLSEVEKIILLIFFPKNSVTMGIFSVVSNIGSTVLRVIFAPIEDLTFTICCQAKNTVELCENAIKPIFLLQTSIGLLGVFYGPLISPLVTLLMYGDSKEVSDGLSVYCYLLLVMSINGITECVWFSRSDTSGIRLAQICQIFSVVISVVFTVFFSFLNMNGVSSLIFGNLFGYFVRILGAFAFFHAEKVSVFHKDYLNVFGVLISLGFCSRVIATILSKYYFENKFLPVGVVLFGLLGSILMLQTEIRKYSEIARKRKAA